MSVSPNRQPNLRGLTRTREHCVTTFRYLVNGVLMFQIRNGTRNFVRNIFRYETKLVVNAKNKMWLRIFGNLVRAHLAIFEKEQAAMNVAHVLERVACSFRLCLLWNKCAAPAVYILSF